jgi:hypothetical protein
MKTGISLVLLGSALLAGAVPAHADFHPRFDDRRYDRWDDRRGDRRDYEVQYAPRGHAYGYWAHHRYERAVVREPRFFVPAREVVIEPPCPMPTPVAYVPVEDPQVYIRLGFDFR